MNSLKINTITQKIQLAKRLESENGLPDFDLSDFSAVSDEQIKADDADKRMQKIKAAMSIMAIKTLGLDPSLNTPVNTAAWDAVCYADLSSNDAAEYAKSFI